MKAFVLFVFSVVLAFACSAQTPAFVWARGLGGPATDYAQSVAVDASGNVYTIGDFAGTADFDPGPSVSNLTSAGNYDIFISKLDSTGAFLWAKRIGNSSADHGNSIAVDATGNVYAAGSFALTADFDPGAGVANLASGGGDDAFILKLDPAGNYLWAKRAGSGGADIASSIAVGSDGHVYTTGNFTWMVDFDPGPGTFNLVAAGNTSGVDVFALKLTASGDFVWAKGMGGASLEQGRAIVLDKKNNVYLAGNFNQTADFDPGPGTFNLFAAGYYDLFVAKLDSAGNFRWAAGMGGDENDFMQSVAVDTLGNVYSTGYFTDSADFDPGTGVFKMFAAGSPGTADAFISKLDSTGAFVWAKRIGGTNYDFAESLTLDDSGQVYLTGRFIGTADLDPGPAVYNLVSAAATEDAFVSKMSAAGNLIWALNVGGGAGGERGRAITVDHSGGIYLAGSFFGTSDFNPGPGAYNLTSADMDGFVLKLGKAPEPTSVREISSVRGLAWTIFPNPSSDYAILTNANPAGGVKKVRLYTLHGQMVQEWAGVEGDVFRIDMHTRPSGIYLIDVTTGRETQHLRLVKQ